MKLTTRITLVFLLAVMAIVVSAWVSHKNTEKISETRLWVEHTQVAIGRFDRLYMLIKEAETSVRGFLVTRKEPLRSSFDQFKTEIYATSEELRTLTADNPAQVERLGRFDALLSSRIDEWNGLIAGVGAVGSPAWQSNLEKSFKSPYAGKLRALVSEMKDEEQALLKVRTQTALKSVQSSQQANFLITAVLVGILGGISLVVVMSMNKAITALLEGTKKIGDGHYDHRINLRSKDELGELAEAFDSMTARVEAYDMEQTGQNWIKKNINEFGLLLQGQRDFEKAGSIILNTVAPLVEARQAALYCVDSERKDDTLFLISSFACSRDSGIPLTVSFGDGSIGQCAIDRKMVHLQGIPSESFKVKSALSQSSAADVYILPILFEGSVRGVLELASERQFSERSISFLEELCGLLGVVFAAISGAQITERLLEESRQLNEDLRLQQEELESQAEELETQQEELRHINDELHQKADALEEQNALVFEKNIELEGMRQSLEDKAQQLAVSSKYKSEFLANMSHDLRTPLNSLLIFSELLAENEEGNLSESQIDFAKSINMAGKTLLTLIDDILDLSKIEAGRVTPDIKNVELADVLLDVERSFRKVSEGKKILFDLKLAPNTPRMIRTDERRLLQLLNNLLSNAFKFTERGSVSLSISAGKPSEGNGHDGDFVTFAVTDTGIGIAAEQQALVFEAFHQADSSSTRKFGGTGLGLSICRELSALLGGWVDVQSELNKGSTFTLHLPVAYKGKIEPKRRSASVGGTAPAESSAQSKEEDAFLYADIPDDRLNIKEGDRVILIIEDDQSFAKMLLDLARKSKFKGVVSMRGRDGLILAHRLLPDAITLDLKLPDIEGWVVLDQLKNSPETRHIPVHIISATSEQNRGMSLGALGYLEKPVTLATLNEAIEKIEKFFEKKSGAVLIAESDDKLRQSLVELLENGDFSIDSVENGENAIKMWGEKPFDCSIINMNLNDMDGLTLARKYLSGNNTNPLLVFSNHGLSEGEKAELEALGRINIVKDIDSPERLLSEVGLFLHRVEAKLPITKQQLVTKVRQEDSTLVGRKLLIVDDDPRNVDALISVLRKYQMTLVTAENGRDALEKLSMNKDVEAVLMDVMMPEMDGYEAMRAIRAQSEFSSLPIIAVTAKAMQGDRVKCLDSGASDYITKPVDRSQLISLLRVWLYKG
ncbi:MAG: response regulator [Candidatus Obscuribacterales bacterium]|nr:response regulator [Candidatus Obscuribacterales bacterium]